MGMVLIIDNYDSFVHNVAHALQVLGAPVEVQRNDAVTVEEALARAPSHIVLSPGPCTPREAGISVDLVRAVAGRIPLLGICLGHQAIAEAYGATLQRSPHPTHGRATPIHHRGRGILRGLPSPFMAGRYHSLSVSPVNLPGALAVEAHTPDGEIMVLRHRTDPVWGVQFHPESILTPGGTSMLRHFLGLSGTGGHFDTRPTRVRTVPSPVG